MSVKGVYIKCIYAVWSVWTASVARQQQQQLEPSRLTLLDQQQKYSAKSKEAKHNFRQSEKKTVIF